MNLCLAWIDVALRQLLVLVVTFDHVGRQRLIPITLLLILRTTLLLVNIAVQNSWILLLQLRLELLSFLLSGYEVLASLELMRDVPIILRSFLFADVVDFAEVFFRAVPLLRYQSSPNFNHATLLMLVHEA